MKFFVAGGCPSRRELFGDHAMLEMRQCDGQELNIQVIAEMELLQHRLRVVQTYSKDDVL